MRRVLYCSATSCVVEEDGRPVEYIPIGEGDRTGSILRGKVDRIMKSLGCAFVDIGGNKAGFLPLEENSRSFTGASLRCGDAVWVQVRREASGSKGPFLSRDLSIPGIYLILMPLNRFTGVSARVTDPAIRERLLSSGKRLSEEKTGLVLRSAAIDATFEELKKEYDSLLDTWNIVSASMAQGDREITLGDVAAELIRDYGPMGIHEIRTPSELPDSVTRFLRSAGDRRIRLPHGGNIVIDRTEALTVIDVNTAGDTTGLSRRETIVQTNLEACDELAARVRLRNLSGIILVDFIDMDEESDRNRVLEHLSLCFAVDRVKTVIHGFTALGLCEMTRKRGRPETIFPETTKG